MRVATAALLAALFLPPGAGGAEPGIEEADPTRWRFFGSFKGSASARLGQVASDLLFEMENDGDLYQDLGALSLGLSKAPAAAKST